MAFTVAQLQASLEASKRRQARYVRCDNCDGFVDPEQFGVVRLKKLDLEGNPVVGPQGEPRYTFVRTPYHVLPVSEFRPTVDG